jgi:adenosylmethionine-8-amino-7-oxononanoate aminotransferase
MTFLEYTKWSYALPGQFWFLGWLWAPALVITKEQIDTVIGILDQAIRAAIEHFRL